MSRVRFPTRVARGHGRLAMWCKWKFCDVGEAKEELENELWRRWSKRKGWWMSCDVGKVTEGLENELWRRWSDWNSKLSVASPTSQLIFQPFPCFTYVTAHSPTLPLLHLHHSLFSNPSFASPTSQDFHLHHMASRPCSRQAWRPAIFV